ncbi:MAG: nitrogenase component 1 [Candidatus Weimeria sp.]
MDKTRIKKQIFTHIPVYSGDVSGAASALYEFGGITVIHDPSGCNSTYNTFDELRWTKRESAVYISGLRESDAIHGNDNRLIDDTCDAVAALSKKPEFIALCNSPVPDIIGTDFTAICHILEERTGIPAFYIQTNAMHDYTAGGANAFLSIAEKFLSGDTSCTTSSGTASSGTVHDNSVPSVNLLGLSPFEYPGDKQIDRLYDILGNAGFSIAANWGRGTAAHPVSFSDVGAAASADVSLVLSSIGLKAAQFLYQRFQIPYVIGDPLVSDEFASVVFKDLKAMETRNSYLDFSGNASAVTSNTTSDSSDSSMAGLTAFIGEPVTMGSEAAALKLSSPETPVALICTTELNDCLVSTAGAAGPSLHAHERNGFPANAAGPAGSSLRSSELNGSLSGQNDLLVFCPHGEAEIAEALKKAAVIHGDPLFKNAYSHGTLGFVPSRQTWVDEPHLAMSGRLFADRLIRS